MKKDFCETFLKLFGLIIFILISPLYAFAGFLYCFRVAAYNFANCSAYEDNLFFTEWVLKIPSENNVEFEGSFQIPVVPECEHQVLNNFETYLACRDCGEIVTPLTNQRPYD